jgi:hypothetical protein
MTVPNKVEDAATNELENKTSPTKEDKEEHGVNKETPLTDGAGNGKRRVRRDQSPIVKERAVKGVVKWFNFRKGDLRRYKKIFLALFLHSVQAMALSIMTTTLRTFSSTTLPSLAKLVNRSLCTIIRRFV